MSTTDLTDPAAVARVVLTAYQGRDLETLSDHTGGSTRLMIKELIELGSGHPRYRSIFDGWRWQAVSTWDGRILGTRYRSRRHPRALVHFHDINEYELAVLVLEWKGGRWEFMDIQSPDAVEYETLGESMGELSDRRPFLAIALLLTLLVAVAPAEPPSDRAPFPPGPSDHEHAGLEFHLEMPRKPDPEKKLSLLVALHGMGSSGREFATWFEPLTDDGFVVCAPKSTGNSWMKPDIEKVEMIVDHLVEKLPIDANRLHGVGFSNGGAHLGFLVFGSDRPYATACWLGSGYTGGKLPRWAKKGMAVLAMAGEQDRAYGAAKSTAARLAGKVRHTDFRSQPDLGHEIPDRLMPYYYYWLSVMEGRHTPGADRSFFWVDDLEVGLETIADRKLGGFVYFFSDQDTASEEDRHLQHVVFFDQQVRKYGRQLVAILADIDLAEEHFKELGLVKTPAVAVLSAAGKPVRTFEGRIDAKALARALRSLAPHKR